MMTETQAGKKCAILVVDDEAIVRENIGNILRDEGFLVWAAADGASAVELAETNRVDIVVLDIKLPDISGVQVLEKIKAVHPGVKAVMITAYEVEEMVAHAFKEGACACLHKPFAIQTLLKIFHELREKHGFGN